MMHPTAILVSPPGHTQEGASESTIPTCWRLWRSAEVDQNWVGEGRRGGRDGRKGGRDVRREGWEKGREGCEEGSDGRKGGRDVRRGVMGERDGRKGVMGEREGGM